MLSVVALALTAGAADATTLVLADETERPQPFQAWVDEAQVPTPQIVLIVRTEKCPFNNASRSCISYPDGTVYLDPEFPNEWRADLRHELGHVADLLWLDEGERNRFRWYVRDRRPWRAEGGNSPHEKFAEAFGLCARSMRWPPRDSGYRYEPSVRLHRRVCHFIRRASS